MMEPEEVCAIFLLTTLLAEKKKRMRRRLWVHPIIQDRQTGAFRQMFSKLLKHPEKFYNYFQMSPSSYEEVHSLIEEKVPQRRTISDSIN
jgi:ClpP class serine protease